ncbi:MAG: AAA family ATPase [Actinomycetota bacterium]|nr:AAA family ATPase [Actinomycetota bacterium]
MPTNAKPYGPDKGAHFYRCDLQVHTPRDSNWTGIDRITDAERGAYAGLLVRACRERGLQGIAITDHHDMAFVEYVRTAAAEETDPHGNPLANEQRLAVFPGMELTLSVPCQALLIFDADFPADMFALAMTALALTPSVVTAAKTSTTQRLTHIQSLRQLKEELDKHTYLKDRYIIFPHVGECGQFSLLRKGQAAKYCEMPCVGGYVDGDITKLGQGNRNIVDGKVKEWGNKRVAVFQTSDNRFEDHRALGRVSTWVKWALPTAEALRQACLAQESRVSQEAPQLPAVAVAGLSVSNSVFLGPIELDLNPQYSALIGGRGTGKSTILEYLRWALCDQPPSATDDDTPNYQARRSRLIEQTLKPVNATVQVQFDVNGVAHAVRRNSQDGALQIKIGSDAMRPCTEDEVRTLLPIQAYSQKQLSDVSVRVDELSRFITAPIRNELHRIEQQASDRAERIRQSHATRRRQRSLSHTLQKRELEEQSLTGQADTLRAALTGLSEEDRALLDKGKVFDAADRSLRVWQTATAAVRKEAAGLSATIEFYLTQPDTPPAEPEAAILEAAHAEYLNLLSEAKTNLDALVRRADLITVAREGAPAVTPWHHWSEKLSAFKTSYEAAVQRSSAHSEKMKQLRDIEEQLDQHVRDMARVRDELRSLTAAETGYQVEREAWETLLRDHDDLLDAQCQGLTQSSGGAVRAHVRRQSDATDFVNGCRQALIGSRVQSSKFEALGDSIAGAPDTNVQWNAVLNELETLAEYDTERDAIERRPETPVLAAAGIPAGDLDRIARSLKPEAWLSLSLTPIKSVPVFEYRARENEYIPFQNASAGQQATALLRTLLNEAGPPLIIDQPEEDLDNPVMLEIVEQVWQAKKRRQLIFSSHNANLVVNGDAELVVWCDHRAAGDQSRGIIAGEGAIDVPTVREAIKAIMEGGEAAFNLRKSMQR